MSLPDIDAIVRIMRDVAETEIRPRFRQLESDEIRRKESGGLVTIADTESERRLGEALSALLPGSVVLGEEAAEGDPLAYDCLSGDAPVWIIDPLDGTSNFAAGNPDYVVIVALAISGVVRVGAILAPETDVLITAEEGGGAWSAGQRLLSDGDNSAEEALLSGSLGRRLRQRDELQGAFASMDTVGSCGLEYLRIALGELDFSHYRGLKPWDHAAGDLIVREAGGMVGFIDESRYVPGGVNHRHGLLTARNTRCWHDVATRLLPALEQLPPLQSR
jgi:fructose-1,6-bisphosphatase/inositol monophosphatase family enzyme